jgi:hypothetical protein
VTFDSARTVRFVPEQFVLTPVHEPIRSVLALGGRVISVSDDSLVIEPHYVTVRDTTRKDGRRTLWRAGPQGLPLLAVVRPDSTVNIGSYRPPKSKKVATAEKLLIAGPGVLLWISMMYTFFTTHW